MKTPAIFRPGEDMRTINPSRRRLLRTRAMHAVLHPHLLSCAFAFTTNLKYHQKR